jgi:ClpA/ClpB-like protein
MADTRDEAQTAPGSPTEVETLARRAARTLDPQAGLEALTALRHRLDELEALQLSAAVEAGLSWTEIGRALGISRQAAHNHYSRRVGPEHGRYSGPRRIVVTAEARHAIHLARQEARGMGADVIGTEHVLLGILGCERSRATWALRAMGAHLEDARAAANATVISSQAEPSLQEALDRGEGYIGVEHLLLAILRDERGGAAQTLRRMNIDPREVLSRLSEL